jgi:dTMP kinase
MQLCYQWLQNLGLSVVLTREPGGTELGSHLRRLLLDKLDNKPISEVTELLLYAADRAQHVEQELKPNLAAGKYVLCDRYTDSTTAYQGYGRGLNLDLTIWLDVDVEVGLARKKGNAVGLDRIEQETITFHRCVQQGYADLATRYPSRIARVDGNLTQAAVQQVIQEILRSRLLLPQVG